MKLSVLLEDKVCSFQYQGKLSLDIVFSISSDFISEITLFKNIMNYDYFERKMGNYAQRTSRIKGKDFIPTYSYNPNRVEIEERQSDPDKTFVPTVWPHYYELFGASSRNRT